VTHININQMDETETKYTNQLQVYRWSLIIYSQWHIDRFLCCHYRQSYRYRYEQDSDTGRQDLL